MNSAVVSICFLVCGLASLLGPILIELLSDDYILEFNAHEYVWHNTLLDQWALCLLVNFLGIKLHQNLVFMFVSQLMAGVFTLLKCILITPVDGSKLICLIFIATFTMLPSCSVLLLRVCLGGGDDTETSSEAERVKVNVDQEQRLLSDDSDAAGSNEEDNQDEGMEKKEHASFNRLMALGDKYFFVLCV